jgi:cytochrome c oxidase cbb3-type subunit 3
MQISHGLLGAALLGLTLVIGQVSAQQPPAAPASPQGDQVQPAQRGGGRGAGQGAGRGAAPGQRRGGRATFPAQQRPPDDPAVVERGKGLYGVNCQVCHGVDLRGGDQGGPNLLRSPEVLNDQDGERLVPIMRNGILPRMPASTLPQEDLHAIAIYLHSVAATMQGQGGPPRGYPTPPAEAVVVGNASAGQAYFAANCASCHSATGDLQGIGGRFTDPRDLQNTWVAGGSVGRRGGGGGRGGAPQVTATVTLPSGERIEGALGRIDEFIVVLEMPDGSERSFPRSGNVPQVEVRDPRQPHRDMMINLSDKDMHDVTAYLWSLK